MKVKCIRPILTEDGVTEIIYYFNPETLKLEFDEKDFSLLLQVLKKQAHDIPDLTEYEAV